METRHELEYGDTHILFLKYENYGEYMINDVHVNGVFRVEDTNDIFGFTTILDEEGYAVIQNVYQPDDFGGMPMSSTDMKDIENTNNKCSEYYDAYIAEDATGQFETMVQSYVDTLTSNTQSEDFTLEGLTARLESLIDVSPYTVMRRYFARDIGEWEFSSRVLVPLSSDISVSINIKCEGFTQHEVLLKACVEIENWRENPKNTRALKEYNRLESLNKSRSDS